MKLNRYIAIFVLTLVAACTTSGGLQSESPAQALYVAKQSYAIALTAAVAYKKLTPCTPTSTPVCSDKAVVARLQKADDAAFALMEGAQAAVDSGRGDIAGAVKAATQAVGAFGSLSTTVVK